MNTIELQAWIEAVRSFLAEVERDEAVPARPRGNADGLGQFIPSLLASLALSA